MEVTLLMGLLFFGIALLYASVGFGGGSSYIAIMLLLGIASSDVRLTALVCNIIVVSGSTINYIRTSNFNFKKILPLVLLSVPMAILGGMVVLHTDIYLFVVGISLLVASIMMLIPKEGHSGKKFYLGKKMLLGIGGAIGFLSGIIGLGGGVFLAPILHLSKWDNVKVIGAACSFFILVNSIAGLIGQSISGLFTISGNLFFLGFCVFVGGQIGSRLNIYYLKPKMIRTMTALLIAYVGLRILIINL